MGMSKRTIRTLVLFAAACAALLAVAATGSAHGNKGDRNHDRIPDRWERAHHLNLKVNQAKRDQDHDGLRNRAEFLAGTDPRNDDSDDDGTHDGAEGAGTVTSFIAGVLTVHLFNGDDVKGTVNDQTEIECEHRSSGHVTARSASEGPGGGDDQGDDDQGDDDHGGHGGGGDDGNDDGDRHDGEHNDGQHDRHGDDNQAGCDATALTSGAVVREAELKTTASGPLFKKVEMVRAG
jgi:hypothetical protein